MERVKRAGLIPDSLSSCVNVQDDIAGAMGVIWSIMWFFLVYDTPSRHPRISDEEKNYIENALNKKAMIMKVVKLSHYYSYSSY